MIIKETCTCGATLEVESESGLEVDCAQLRFHEAHWVCRDREGDSEEKE